MPRPLCRFLGTLGRSMFDNVILLLPARARALTRTPRLLRHFANHDGGSAGLLFALAFIPMTLAVGAALDYGMANKAKAKLDAAADSAALAAVDRQTMTVNAAAAQVVAQNVFSSLTSAMPNLTISSASANVTDNGLSRSVVVSYSASSPLHFMSLAGMSALTIKGQSTAVSGMSTYIDFYLLLDNTPSMGVGATPGDVATLVNHTPDQCAFACHDLSNTNNYYNLAKTLNVTMRIDVVRQATQQLMDTAIATASQPDQYRMAIYTFGSSAATAGLTSVAALTSDLTSAKNAAANIDLMTVSGQNQNNDQDTNYDGIFPALNTAIPAAGAGTKTTPQKVLFFVSDGVSDENLGGKRTIAPINLSLCSTLKSRGVLIAVLYTTYLPLPTNTFYNQNVKPFVNNIGPTMQSCASPGLYFEVSPTQGISAAMTALFQKAVQSARLTK
jgi:Flp pilus assembly protein TadG